MRITLFAVGRLKSGPESELSGRYLDRFAKSGGALGLDFARTIEVAESRASTVDLRKKEEAALLIAGVEHSTEVGVVKVGREVGFSTDAGPGRGHGLHVGSKPL